MVEKSKLVEVGSDGGKIETGGSFAWLLLTSKFQPIWRCAGLVDGWARCQSSRCSELFSIASLCLALEEFCLSDKFWMSNVRYASTLIPTSHQTSQRTTNWENSQKIRSKCRCTQHNRCVSNCLGKDHPKPCQSPSGQ